LDADVVRQVRLGRHPNNTTRIVLDAAGVSSYSVYPLYSPFRIVIDCVRAASLTTVAPAPITPAPVAPAPVATTHDPDPAPLRARRLAPVLTLPPAAVSPKAADVIAKAAALEDDETKAAVPLDTSAAVPNASSAPVVPPAKNTTGGFSMSRQLGLGVSRIVIDAGHGGHDPGAKGKGVTEAELVLDVALKLEKLLQKVPGVEVILTRRTDEFIPLQERTAIANREGADVFLSIHANASPNAQARGIETYFLNFANNLSAAAVAAQENAASGQTMGALPDLVKAIALNNKLDESRDLATQVQRAMMDKLSATNKTIRDLGVKQAPFVVLIGAAMPSVLAEISFVTNPQEAKLLKGNAYRQRIADALFNAIRKYRTSLKNATSVAQQ
jgi:N-acetylmuramoyl-L-alanine amidase